MQADQSELSLDQQTLSINRNSILDQNASFSLRLEHTNRTHCNQEINNSFLFESANISKIHKITKEYKKNLDDIIIQILKLNVTHAEMNLIFELFIHLTKTMENCINSMHDGSDQIPLELINLFGEIASAKLKEYHTLYKRNKIIKGIPYIYVRIKLLYFMC